MRLYAVILAGGKGERFWPKSRAQQPKQFIKLFGKNSLIVETSRRIKPLIPLIRQYYVLSPNLGQLLKKELKIKKKNLIYEPYGKNTAPAIALAAIYLEKLDPKGTMVVLPADHIIKEREKLLECLEFASGLAEKNYLITFGILPTIPETGYGYIEIGQELETHGEFVSYKVKRFVEKPDLETAEEYLASGRYLWNSGIFVFKINTILNAIRECLPDFYGHLLEFKKTLGSKKEKRALKKLYAEAPGTSIDYAVLEKISNIAVIKANFSWDDVGSWLAVERHFPQDALKNVKLGTVVAHQTKNSIIVADTGLVATMGIENLIVIQTKDVTLVMKKEDASNLKELIKMIAQDKKNLKYL
jgi:mannose-1-phosphate guanylyltransferase